MELIESGELIHIIISIDVAKLKSYGSIRYSNTKGSDESEIIEFKENIGLKLKDKVKFKERFDEILLANKTNKKLKNFDLVIKQQQSDLIFIRNYLIKSGQKYVYEKNNDLEKFAEIVKLMDKVNDVDVTDGLKVTFIKENRKVNPTIKLPIAQNSKILYEYIAKAVYQYFIDHSTGIMGLKWYLLDYYKEPVTLDALKKYLKYSLSTYIPEPFTLIGFYTYSLLPYVAKLPQFQQKKIKKTLIPTKQATFLLNFFRLFGMDGKDFKINLSYGASEISVKELNRIYARFLRDYINISV